MEAAMFKLVILATLVAIGVANAETAEEISVQRYGRLNQSCAAWTDGCVSCTRAVEDKFVCSNIGPACQPTANQCTQTVQSKPDTPNAAPAK
jgi:hypothetical protein